MNKILGLTAFIVLTISFSHAQVLYQQDFENGLGDMITVDNDSLIAFSAFEEFGSDWMVHPPEVRSELTSFGIISNSWFDPVGVADDWLITPEIEISELVNLDWRAVSSHFVLRNSYRVLISTEGPEISNFNTVLFEIGEEEPNWVQREIDLSQYLDQSVWIAFHHNSNNKDLLILDNIFVRVPPQKDASVDSLFTTDSQYISYRGVTIAPSQNQSIFAEITNQGTGDINSLDIEFSIDGVNFTTVTQEVDLAPGDSFVFTSTFEEPDQGEYDISVAVTKVNDEADENPFDNKKELEIHFFPPVPDLVVNDSNGNEIDIHGLLRDGNTVMVKFMGSFMPEIGERSTPALNNYYQLKGSGEEDFKVIGMTILPSDTDEVINSGLISTWGAEYPQVAYSVDQELFWMNFEFIHGLGNNQGPFYVMICPNIGDPKNSEVIASTIGHLDDPFFFINIFDEPLNACTEKLVDVEDVSVEEKYKIYPNPISTGTLNLDLDLNKSSEVKVNILNAQGQLVKQIGKKKIESGFNSMQIDVANLNTGIYFVQVKENDSINNIKITVLR